MWRLCQLLPGSLTAASVGCGHVLPWGVVESSTMALGRNISTSTSNCSNLKCMMHELRMMFTPANNKPASAVSKHHSSAMTGTRQYRQQSQPHAGSWPSQSYQLVSLPAILRHPATAHTASACHHRAAILMPSLARTCATTAGAKLQRKQPTSAADLAMYLGAAVIAVIGLSYAMVPLYRLFCVATGYGGQLAGAETVEAKIQKRLANPNPELEKRAAQRELTVWFNADVADDMPWAFKPTQECVRIKAGQSALAFFTAHNKSDRPVTGYSLYNVTPDKAAQYFNKIQCFCFEEQRLRAGETVDMPVFFYIDPELVADWNCRNIQDITLSYVFHKVDDADLEDVDDDQPSGVKLHGVGLEELPPGITPPVMTPGTAGSTATQYQQAAAVASQNA